MIEDKLLKQSPLYGDMMEEGTGKGGGDGIAVVMVVRGAFEFADPNAYFRGMIQPGQRSNLPV